MKRPQSYTLNTVTFQRPKIRIDFLFNQTLKQLTFTLSDRQRNVVTFRIIPHLFLAII